MPPPLLLLQDISLTFGATPLLSGAALAVAAHQADAVGSRDGQSRAREQRRRPKGQADVLQQK